MVVSFQNIWNKGGYGFKKMGCYDVEILLHKGPYYGVSITEAGRNSTRIQQRFSRDPTKSPSSFQLLVAGVSSMKESLLDEKNLSMQKRTVGPLFEDETSLAQRMTSPL